MKKQNTVLLWGFYDQGNLGDDLMAIMVADLVRSLGLQPIIASANVRFRQMGYQTVTHLDECEPSAVILSGGAFFKSRASTKSSIESKIEELSVFIEKNKVSVIGLSLGSDGVSCLSEVSAARRAVVTSPFFKGTTLRLRQDLALGLKGAIFLPDIVFATKRFRYASGVGTAPPSVPGQFLINLSRRTIFSLPMALWLGRGQNKASFLAHSGDSGMGGELVLPMLPAQRSDNMFAAIDSLGAASGILSSKLHPGIMALSMGRIFYSISPRPKTLAFIDEYTKDNIVSAQRISDSTVALQICKDLDWQENLWVSYRDFLVGHIGASENL